MCDVRTESVSVGGRESNLEACSSRAVIWPFGRCANNVVPYLHTVSVQFPIASGALGPRTEPCLKHFLEGQLLPPDAMADACVGGLSSFRSGCKSANGLGLRVREEGAGSSDIGKNGRGSGEWHGRSVSGKSSGTVLPSCVWILAEPSQPGPGHGPERIQSTVHINRGPGPNFSCSASDPSVGPSATVAFYTRRALRASYRPLPPTLNHTPTPPDLPLPSNIISLSRRASDCDASPC